MFHCSLQYTQYSAIFYGEWIIFLVKIHKVSK